MESLILTWTLSWWKHNNFHLHTQCNAKSVFRKSLFDLSDFDSVLKSVWFFSISDEVIKREHYQAWALENKWGMHLIAISFFFQLKHKEFVKLCSKLCENILGIEMNWMYPRTYTMQHQLQLVMNLIWIIEKKSNMEIEFKWKSNLKLLRIFLLPNFVYNYFCFYFILFFLILGCLGTYRRVLFK